MQPLKPENSLGYSTLICFRGPFIDDVRGECAVTSSGSVGLPA